MNPDDELTIDAAEWERDHGDDDDRAADRYERSIDR